MGTLTSFWDELAKERHVPPDELLGKMYPYRNSTDEIKKQIFANENFMKNLLQRGIKPSGFEDVATEEYVEFLNGIIPQDAHNFASWFSKDRLTISRDSAIRILFALQVSDIKDANHFILRACGDDAYALYARDYKDLIYKFCLQNSKKLKLGLDCAERLIEKYSLILKNQYDLLKDVLTDLAASFGMVIASDEIIRVIWEGFFNKEVNHPSELDEDELWEKFYRNEVAGGKKVIRNFCKKHNSRLAQIALINIVERLSDKHCNEKKAEAFFSELKWDEFFNAIKKKGPEIIKKFCKMHGIEESEQKEAISNYNEELVEFSAQKMAIAKFLNNYRVFKAIILDLAEKHDEIESGEGFLSKINWIDFFENEKKNGRVLIEEFCEACDIDDDEIDAAINRYEEDLGKKNKGTVVFDSESSNVINTLAELKIFLEDNKYLFGMYRRTAYKKLREYYEMVAQPFTEKHGIDETDDKTLNNVTFEGFFNELIRIGDENEEEGTDPKVKLKSLTIAKKKTKMKPRHTLMPEALWREKIKSNTNNSRHNLLATIQKIIMGNAILNSSQLKENLNMERQVLRKYFIWVFMYSWGEEIEDPQGPIAALNNELRECGFPILDSLNPFDFIVMNAMFYEKSFEEEIALIEMDLEESERRKNAQGKRGAPLSTEEESELRDELERLKILQNERSDAFDEIKRLVVDFYNLTIEL